MDTHIREPRGHAGLTQAEFGEAMGVSRNTINSIENGRTIPSPLLLLSLARYFRRSVEEVFG